MADKPTPLKAKAKATVIPKYWKLIILPGSTLVDPDSFDEVEIAKPVLVEVPDEALASVD